MTGILTGGGFPHFAGSLRPGPAHHCPLECERRNQPPFPPNLPRVESMIPFSGEWVQILPPGKKRLVPTLDKGSASWLQQKVDDNQTADFTGNSRGEGNPHRLSWPSSPFSPFFFSHSAEVWATKFGICITRGPS